MLKRNSNLDIVLKTDGGVKVDCDEAMFWYVRATKHKHDRAASYLYQLAKEYYGLTADQVKFFCDLKEDGSIF